MDLADGLSLSAKQAKQLESAVAILSGIGAWEFQATEKFDHNVPLISKQRFGDAIAQTFGKNVATKIFPNTPIQGTQTINPGAVFNQTTFTGIGLLIADKLLDEFVGTEYRKIDGLQPVIRGAGKGITFGGILGGLVDATYTASGYGGALPQAGGPYAFKSYAFPGNATIDRLNR